MNSFFDDYLVNEVENQYADNEFGYCECGGDLGIRNKDKQLVCLDCGYETGEFLREDEIVKE